MKNILMAAAFSLACACAANGQTAGEYDRALRSYISTTRASFRTPASTDSITILLTSPSVAAQSDYTVRACVRTGGRMVDKRNLFLNGSAVKGITITRNDGCDQSLNQAVTLRRGENMIKVEVTAGGNTVSETFIVTLGPSGPNNKYADPDPIHIDVVDGRRVALVLGNSKYKNAAQLTYPANDAKRVAEKLRGLNFKVIDKTDVEIKDMRRVLDDFVYEARNSAVALFYYNGHGIQHNNVNYLLPVDVENLKSQSLLTGGAMSLDNVLDAMAEANVKMKIVVLDACRDNPFKNTKGVANRGGLTTSLEKPEGTFMMFAAEDGKVALDNGTFTNSFLKYVDAPGVPIETLFKKIRADVKKETNNTQVPECLLSFENDFYFK